MIDFVGKKKWIRTDTKKKRACEGDKRREDANEKWMKMEKVKLGG